MILYQLLCHKGHDFEAWFRNSGTYDQQVVAGDVACPFCGDALGSLVSTAAGSGSFINASWTFALTYTRSTMSI